MTTRLSTRIRNTVRSPTAVVRPTAILVALLAAYLVMSVTPWNYLFTPILVVSGIVVPVVFEHQWPKRETVRRAFTWALVVSTTAVAMLVAVAVTLLPFVGTIVSGGIAFLVSALGSAAGVEVYLRQTGLRVPSRLRQ